MYLRAYGAQDRAHRACGTTLFAYYVANIALADTKSHQRRILVFHGLRPDPAGSLHESLGISAD